MSQNNEWMPKQTNLQKIILRFPYFKEPTSGRDSPKSILASKLWAIQKKIKILNYLEILSI